MKCQVIFVAAVLAGTAACGAGTAPMEPEAIAPAEVMNFEVLYAKNCSGCHGAEGKGGAAIGLANPIYLAIADDETVTRVTSDGVTATSMPAFAKRSGGLLTDNQIAVVAKGIRARWAQPSAIIGAVGETQPPPYAALNPGDPKRGEAAFAIFCASCHGPEGRGGRAASIVDSSYLALVSDQSLRTTIIAGRPEMGNPDWRGYVPGKPMSPDDVSDIVAWLAARRPQGRSQ